MLFRLGSDDAEDVLYSMASVWPRTLAKPSLYVDYLPMRYWYPNGRAWKLNRIKKMKLFETKCGLLLVGSLDTFQ